MILSGVEKKTLLMRAYADLGISISNSGIAIPTDTCKFLLNTVFDYNYIELQKHYGLVNAYLDDEQYNEESVRNCGSPLLFVLLTNLSCRDEVFHEVEKAMRSHAHWMDCYDVGDYSPGYVTMHVFKIPIMFEKDYNNFLQGRYSSISHSLKKHYVPTVREICDKTEESHQFWSNYYGFDVPHSQEFYSVYNPDRETFRFKEQQELDKINE